MPKEQKPSQGQSSPLSPEEIAQLKHMREHGLTMVDRILANVILTQKFHPRNLPEVPPEKQHLS